MSGEIWSDPDLAKLDAEIRKGNTPMTFRCLFPHRTASAIKLRYQSMKADIDRGYTPPEPAEKPEHPAVKLPEDEQLRLIRKLEGDNRTLKTKLDGEKKLREQTEHDLSQIEDTNELIAATQDKVTARKLERRQKRKDRGKATAIFCATDWHIEERIDAADINGLNEFNLEIAEKRIARTFEKFLYLLDFARGISDIKEGVLWLGGDLINGWIHEELQEANFLGPAQAIVYAQDQICTGVDHLLKHSGLDFLTVVCNQGNHGRSTIKPMTTGYKASWEWAAYMNLARVYRTNPKIRWQIAQGYHNWLSIHGHDVRFHHGDNIRYHGGVGTLAVPTSKCIAAWNKSRVASLDIFGHYHQWINYWNWLSVGCLCGYNGYALKIKADFQPPTQAFCVIDESYGKTMALPIFCEASK